MVDIRKARIEQGKVDIRLDRALKREQKEQEAQAKAEKLKIEQQKKQVITQLVGEGYANKVLKLPQSVQEKILNQYIETSSRWNESIASLELDKTLTEYQLIEAKEKGINPQQIKSISLGIDFKSRQIENAKRRYEGVPTERAEALAREKGFESAEQLKAIRKREAQIESGQTQSGIRYFLDKIKGVIVQKEGALKGKEIIALGSGQVSEQDFKRFEQKRNEIINQLNNVQTKQPKEFKQEIIASLSGKIKEKGGLKDQNIEVVDTLRTDVKTPTRINTYSGYDYSSVPIGTEVYPEFFKNVPEPPQTPQESLKLNVIKTLSQQGKEVTVKGDIITAKGKDIKEIINLFRDGKEVLAKVPSDTIVRPAFIPTKPPEPRKSQLQLLTDIGTARAESMASTGEPLREFTLETIPKTYDKVKKTVVSFEQKYISPVTKKITAKPKFLFDITQASLEAQQQAIKGNNLFPKLLRGSYEASQSVLTLVGYFTLDIVRNEPAKIPILLLSGGLAGQGGKFLLGTGKASKVASVIGGSLYAGSVGIEATVKASETGDIQEGFKVVGKRASEATLFFAGAKGAEFLKQKINPKIEITKPKKSAKLRVLEKTFYEDKKAIKSLSGTIESQKQIVQKKIKVKGYEKVVKQIDPLKSGDILGIDSKSQLRKAGNKYILEQYSFTGKVKQVNEIRLPNNQRLVIVDNKPVIKQKIPSTVKIRKTEPTPFEFRGDGVEIRGVQSGKDYIITAEPKQIKGVIDPSKTKLTTLKGEKTFTLMENLKASDVNLGVDKALRLKSGKNLDITQVFKKDNVIGTVNQLLGINVPSLTAELEILTPTTSPLILSSKSIFAPISNYPIIFPFRLTTILNERISESKRETITQTRQLTKQATKQTFKRKPILKQESALEQESLLSLKPVLSVKPAEEQKVILQQKPILEQKQNQSQVVISATTLKTKNRNIIKLDKDLTTDELYHGWGVTFSHPSSYTAKKGYDVFTRVRKKEVKLNAKPLTRDSALSKGAKYVDETPATTFRIKESSDKSKPLEDYDRYFRQNEFKFRQYSKKTKQRFTNTYIEKEKYRIDSFGELAGITKKGLLSSKRKRWF